MQSLALPFVLCAFSLLIGWHLAIAGRWIPERLIIVPVLGVLAVISACAFVSAVKALGGGS